MGHTNLRKKRHTPLSRETHLKPFPTVPVCGDQLKARPGQPFCLLPFAPDLFRFVISAVQPGREGMMEPPSVCGGTLQPPHTRLV